MFFIESVGEFEWIEKNCYNILIDDLFGEFFEWKTHEKLSSSVFTIEPIVN